MRVRVMLSGIALLITVAEPLASPAGHHATVGPIAVSMPHIDLRVRELVPTGPLRIPTLNKYKVCDIARCDTVDELASANAVGSTANQPAQFHCYANANFDYLERSKLFTGETLSSCDIEIYFLGNQNCLNNLTYAKTKCSGYRENEYQYYGHEGQSGAANGHRNVYYCEDFGSPACRGNWRLDLVFYFALEPQYYRWVEPLASGCGYVSYELQYIQCGWYYWHRSVAP